MLGYVSLTSLVNLNVPDLPRRLPPGFYSGTPEPVEMDQFRMTQFKHARTVASTSVYGSPSKPVQLRPFYTQDVKLVHSIENMTIDAIILEALRQLDNYQLQERGRQWVEKQVAEFRRRFKHLRDVLALMALVKGLIYRNSAGDILPSTSGEDTNLRVDYKVPAGNSGTISALTGVGGTWDSPTTNIPLQLKSFKIIAQQATGYIPEIILYGKNVDSWITSNDYVIPYLSRNGERRDQWLKDGYIAPNYDLFGYQWYQVYDAGWTNAAGTYTIPIGDNDIVILPMADENWWGWAEGSYTVPTNINVSSGMNLDSFMSGTAKVYGQFGYCKIFDDPVRLMGLMGDTTLPYFKVPEVAYYASVV